MFPLDAVTVITVPGMDFGLHDRVNYMSWVADGFASGRQVQVDTAGTLDVSAGSNPKGSIYQGSELLNQAILSTPGKKVVLGYSQGAQVAGTWLRNHADDPAAPPASDLSFVMIGNPERALGKRPGTKFTTPTNTKYGVTDIARAGDPWADYGSKPRPAQHFNYWNVKADTPGGTTVGNTRFVRVG